jgi:hypothetical protein
MSLLSVFRRSAIPAPGLAPATAFAGWDDGAWRAWEAPLNAIRGEQSYQAAVRRFAGKRRKNGWLVPVCVDLTREPQNRFDRNAVKASIAGTCVGYLARDLAATVAPQMQRQRIAQMSVCGIVRGGQKASSGNLGVHIWPHRRLSAGVWIPTLVDLEVSWPPYASEGMA